jgi:STE24 endopeptidase
MKRFPTAGFPAALSAYPWLVSGSRLLRRLLVVLLLTGLFAGTASAGTIVRDLPPGLQIPAAAQPGPAFDADKATEAYLNLLTPQQRELSDRYFEGGYWIQLWQTLWTVGTCALLLLTGIAQRLRDWTQRVSHRRWLSTSIFIALFLLASFLLDMPLSIYTDYLREKQYGLTTQAFSGWLSDTAIIIAVNATFAALLLTAIYAAIRRAGSRWWLWASGLTFTFIMVFSLVAPVYVAPLLNDYKPLPAGPTRDAVLSALRANDIPTDHVEWFDASKQTTRLSANVSGLFGTTRIALNDNLLNKSSLPEIKAVLGHEMGHYVLNHVWKEPILFGLVITFALGLLHISMDGALARWGQRLGLGDRADPAALPLAWALAVTIALLTTPLQNSITRSYEAEADAFGLNAAREPQAWAMGAMRLSTYRKLQPGPVEEFLFYDHPSGYERVHHAMLWFKENQATAETATAAETGAVVTK